MIWAMHNISRLIYAESLVGLNHLLGLVGLMGLTVATCGYLFFGYSDNCLVVQLGSNPTTFHFCLINFCVRMNTANPYFGHNQMSVESFYFACAFPA